MNQILTSRVLVVFLFISTFIVQAQVSFDIKVSKKRLGLNERLRVDFVMNENGDNFNPPSFKGFQVVSGPQQAVSRSWVNGMQSFSKTYTYFLTPKLKGKITLDQAVDFAIRRTKSFAKRQYTWFNNRYDESVKVKSNENLSLIVESFYKIN